MDVADINSCPEWLRLAGLFDVTFAKYPASARMQRVAIHAIAQRALVLTAPAERSRSDIEEQHGASESSPRVSVIKQVEKKIRQVRGSMISASTSVKATSESCRPRCNSSDQASAGDAGAGSRPTDPAALANTV